FEGLGSLEFKWDQRQRRQTIVGLAVGRTDRHGEIASLSGINLPLAAYRHELGLEPLTLADIDRTAAWRDSALLAKKMPALSPNMRIYDGYWRSDDPLPAVQFYSRIGLDWIYRRIVEPVVGRVVEMYPVIVRSYHHLIRTILHRGKASAR